jgi:prepilin-type N-terminal cleavage/methylation domain-containing protein
MNYKVHYSVKIKTGFTLLEALIATALLGIAMVSAFSMNKILSSSKSVLDDRTNFYLASESINANYQLMLVSLTSTDIQNFSVTYLTSNTCTTNSNITMQDKTQTILCSTKIPYAPSLIAPKKAYNLSLKNNFVQVGSTILIQVKLTFMDSSTNNILFERFFQYVK